MNIDFIIDSIKSRVEEKAIVSDGKEYTFGDIYSEYIRACEILGREGITSGSTVTLAGEFSPESVAFLLALISRDSIIIPVSMAVKNVDSYNRIAESQHFIDLREGMKISSSGQEITNPLTRRLISEGHPGLVLFSSGTTGEPKAALHDMTRLMKKFARPGKRMSSVMFLLFDHIGGFNTLMYSLANGGLMVTLKDRSPEEVCRLIGKYKVELLPASPTFLNMLLLSRLSGKYDLSSLRMITYGTEPMPESTLKALHGIMPDVRLKQTYGLSELGIMPTKSDSSDSLYLKLGGEGFETKIVDGILYVRAESAMLGYLNAPSPFDSEGWFNTQDRVEIRNGSIKILGRTTDLINVGGEKVYPNEVESVLLAMEGVLDVHVYGEDNMLTGKTVTAEIQVSPENNTREFVRLLRRYSGEHLEAFKRPVKYRLTDKPLYSSRFKKKR